MKIKEFNWRCILPTTVEIIKTVPIRKTLNHPVFDLSYVKPEDFVVEFLAHIRLHHRLEKRHLKNKKYQNTK